MRKVVDFEQKRAERSSQWTRWTTAVPACDLAVRIRGQVRLSGERTDAPEGGLYCRRGQALCLIEQDGSLRVVNPPYTDLEWTPG